MTVNEYMYSCGTNCSTCSLPFQDKTEIKPNFTDFENPCTPYCYFDQVRLHDAKDMTTVQGGPGCKDAVSPDEGNIYLIELAVSSVTRLC